MGNDFNWLLLATVCEWLAMGDAAPVGTGGLALFTCSIALWCPVSVDGPALEPERMDADGTLTEEPEGSWNRGAVDQSPASIQ